VINKKECPCSWLHEEKFLSRVVTIRMEISFISNTGDANAQ
jgi:hypothetical protein